MRVLLSPLTRAPLPTRVFFFFLPSFPPPLPFAIRQSALLFPIAFYKFQFSSRRPKRGANGKGASERKKRGLLSLTLSFSLSLSLSLDVSSVLRVSSFSRVVFPPSRCVKCYSSGTFPKKVQLFFCLLYPINLGFHLSCLRHSRSGFRRRHSFGLFSSEPPPPSLRFAARERA